MKSMKKSPYAAYVCTNTELAEADTEMLECREDMSVVNMDAKAVPTPKHTTFLAAVSRNQKGGKSAE